MSTPASNEGDNTPRRSRHPTVKRSLHKWGWNHGPAEERVRGTASAGERPHLVQSGIHVLVRLALEAVLHHLIHIQRQEGRTPGVQVHKVLEGLQTGAGSSRGGGGHNRKITTCTTGGTTRSHMASRQSRACTHTGWEGVPECLWVRTPM
jgi:hypothetical protein